MNSAGKYAPGRLPLGAIVMFLAVIFSMVLSGPATPAERSMARSEFAYGPRNAQPGSNLLDVYFSRRRTGGSRPVVVWIHGGGWFKGDKASRHMRRKARTLLWAGYIFVSVNYRLSPDPRGPRALAPGRVRFPTPQNDVARAIGWVDRNIGRFGGSRKRILLGGESAGGQIASLLATRPAFLGAQGVSTRQIKGVLSLDGIGFDLEAMMTPSFGRRSPGLQRVMFNAFGAPGEEWWVPRWSEASPLRFADPGDPPTFFAVPARGIERGFEARQMASRLGQRFELVSMRPRASHSGVSASFGRPGYDMGLTARVLGFFRSAVNPTRSFPVIRGPRVIRAVPVRNSATAGGGRSGRPRATLRLWIGSRPEARQVTCRMDGRPETSCFRVWRLDPGVHVLRVTTYGVTGRPGSSRRERIRVIR